MIYCGPKICFLFNCILQLELIIYVIFHCGPYSFYFVILYCILLIINTNINNSYDYNYNYNNDDLIVLLAYSFVNVCFFLWIIS